MSKLQGITFTNIQENSDKEKWNSLQWALPWKQGTSVPAITIILKN